MATNKFLMWEAVSLFWEESYVVFMNLAIPIYESVFRIRFHFIIYPQFSLKCCQSINGLMYFDKINFIPTLILKMSRLHGQAPTEYNETEIQNAFRAEGYEDGYEEGEDRMAALYRIILDNKRYDDLNRSTNENLISKELTQRQILYQLFILYGGDKRNGYKYEY